MRSSLGPVSVLLSTCNALVFDMCACSCSVLVFLSRLSLAVTCWQGFRWFWFGCHCVFFDSLSDSALWYHSYSCLRFAFRRCSYLFFSLSVYLSVPFSYLRKPLTCCTFDFFLVCCWLRVEIIFSFSQISFISFNNSCGCEAQLLARGVV